MLAEWLVLFDHLVYWQSKENLICIFDRSHALCLFFILCLYQDIKWLWCKWEKSLIIYFWCSICFLTLNISTKMTIIDEWSDSLLNLSCQLASNLLLPLSTHLKRAHDLMLFFHHRDIKTGRIVNYLTPIVIACKLMMIRQRRILLLNLTFHQHSSISVWQNLIAWQRTIGPQSCIAFPEDGTITMRLDFTNTSRIFWARHRLFVT